MLLMTSGAKALSKGFRFRLVLLTFLPYFYVVEATITSKGQITIPIEIRERLGLKAGQKLEFDEKAPFLKAHRAIDREKARKILGSKAKELKGRTVAQWMDWLRGPVELPPRKAKGPRDSRRR